MNNLEGTHSEQPQHAQGNVNLYGPTHPQVPLEAPEETPSGTAPELNLLSDYQSTQNLSTSPRLRLFWYWSSLSVGFFLMLISGTQVSAFFFFEIFCLIMKVEAYFYV